MRYFFDTEFIEYPCTIDLISIGIVDEKGHQFYRESSEVDWSKASDWVLKNVKPQLDSISMPRRRIAVELQEFINKGSGKPEFWAYYADYDWVAFCWLFGPMIDLPNGFPMFCRDVKQYADSLGGPELPPTFGGEHHALDDAIWTKEAWEFLKELENSGDA